MPDALVDALTTEQCCSQGTGPSRCTKPRRVALLRPLHPRHRPPAVPAATPGQDRSAGNRAGGGRGSRAPETGNRVTFALCGRQGPWHRAQKAPGLQLQARPRCGCSPDRVTPIPEHRAPVPSILNRSARSWAQSRPASPSRNYQQPHLCPGAGSGETGCSDCKTLRRRPREMTREERPLPAAWGQAPGKPGCVSGAALAGAGGGSLGESTWEELPGGRHPPEDLCMPTTPRVQHLPPVSLAEGAVDEPAPGAGIQVSSPVQNATCSPASRCPSARYFPVDGVAKAEGTLAIVTPDAEHAGPARPPPQRRLGS